MTTKDIRSEIRDHIASEIRVLTWIQADASGEEQAPEPQFQDLDSFTFIQLILSLEAQYDLELLEDLGDYNGTDFDAVADFVAVRVERARSDVGAP